MKYKVNLKEFIDACIGSGRYVETGLNLPKEEILEIETILNRYNDSVAKTKILKIMNKKYF